VHEKAKITVSAGIAANAKLAKICSNINKPNGQFCLPSDRNSIMAFMRDLPTRKVNGIGRVFERELDAIGVKTCGDIYAERQYLSSLFGEKAFAFLMQCYLGLGRTKVQPAEDYERKSVGTESTFADMSDPKELRDKLKATAEELEKDMLRTQFKGRTLCLKVKLQTYEVFTRQVIPPKAIYLAEDLYKYSVPMLAKLESEFPRIRLRLMGLRCTHLVSMKKPDTMAFFGFKKRPDTNDSDSIVKTTTKRKAEAVEDDSEQWEVWPDEIFEDAERQEREEDMEEMESLSQEVDKRRHHGKEILPNPKKESAAEEEWWDCPICNRPQTPREKEFNIHIDLCLSRQTIREAVHEISEAPRSTERTSVPNKKTKFSNEKSKDKTGVKGDPKQKRLFFG
jgi:DNA polymerase kappa